MAQITVKYGVGNSVTLDFEDGVTMSQVLGDIRVRAALGLGDNVEGSICNVAIPASTIVPSGATVNVHNKACSKAHNSIPGVLACTNCGAIDW